MCLSEKSDTRGRKEDFTMVVSKYTDDTPRGPYTRLPTSLFILNPCLGISKSGFEFCLDQKNKNKF